MRGYICGVSAPRDAVLLFRQKDPKPGVPGRGPSGAFARSQLLGCGTRFAQTVLAPISASGPGRSCALRRHEGAAWDGGGTKGKGKGNDAGSFT